MTTRISRRNFTALTIGLGVTGLAGRAAFAQQQFFRIGTGGTAGTYYPIGGIIANAVSTDKIVSTAQATNQVGQAVGTRALYPQSWQRSERSGLWNTAKV